MVVFTYLTAEIMSRQPCLRAKSFDINTMSANGMSFSRGNVGRIFSASNEMVGHEPCLFLLQDLASAITFNTVCVSLRFLPSKCIQLKSVRLPRRATISLADRSTNPCGQWSIVLVPVDVFSMTAAKYLLPNRKFVCSTHMTQVPLHYFEEHHVKRQCPPLDSIRQSRTQADHVLELPRWVARLCPVVALPLRCLLRYRQLPSSKNNDILEITVDKLKCTFENTWVCELNCSALLTFWAHLRVHA